MSQADELLNSLTDEQVSTYLANSESEPHIVIGSDRHIKVPESLKRIAVENDHNVETVVFDCPRYWDDHDLSQMVIYINYKLSNGFTGSYIADNIIADGDILHFSWTITRTITAVKGNIIFLVCAKKTDADGNEENHWNSELNTEMYVSEGLETDLIVEDEYPDVVTQLLERMYVVEGINVQADEMRALVADAEAAKTETENARDIAVDSSNYIKNSYAPAIKGQVSGEIIRVDDVSPIEHDILVKVGGRNRFNIASYQTEKDYSTGKTIYAISAENLVIGKTYTVSSTIPMRWFKISNSATGYSCVGLVNSTTGFTSYTFTHNRNINIRESDPLYIYTDNLEQTAMNDPTIMNTMNIMITEGSVAMPYEPYIDPSTMTLTACGRNIFKPGTIDEYYHTYTVSISAGGDISGTIIASNGAIAVNVNRKYPSGTYAISYVYSGDSPRILLRVYNEDGVELSTCSELTSSGFTYNDSYKGFFKNGLAHIITIPDSAAYWCMGFVFPVSATNPIDSVTKYSYIQIQRATDTGDYEQYKGADYTPASDGTVTVTSKSPITTLFTDTPGVTIDAEYNRDTTKMFESYVLTDEAKSEIAGIIENHVLTNTEKVEIAAMVEDDMADVLASLNSYAASLIGGDS